MAQFAEGKDLANLGHSTAVADGAEEGSLGDVKTVPDDMHFDKILEFSALRKANLGEFLDVVDDLRGLKCVYMEPELRSMVDGLFDEEPTQVLKSRGVQYYWSFFENTLDFSSQSGRVTPEKIIFILRPKLEMMKYIAHQINNLVSSGVRSQCHVYLVPNSTVVAEQVLEDEGVLEYCEIGELNLGFVPIDGDLLTLEMGSVFKECYVDGDTSSLHPVALALYQLQKLYGVIPTVKSKGVAARKVLHKAMHLRKANSNASRANSSHKRSQIDTLVVMDREADLVSPLLSPLTYEGLVDELFGIDQAQIKMTAAELGDSGPGGSLTQDGSEAVKTTPAEEDTAGEALLTVPLSDVDGIFTQIRDLSIERLGAFLQEKAITIKERYTSFRSNKDASIPEIHDFVKKIPQLTKDYRSLNRHINIASIIKEVTDGKEFRDQWQGERGMLEGETFLDDIERIICADAEGKEFYRILRLMCIQSLTAGGIRASRYDTLRRSIIQTYGYEHLFTLSNCERAGLLKKKDIILVDTTQSVWQGVRKQLKLIDDDVDVINPTSISYVSSGYAPLSVRLVEKLGTRGPQSWRGIGEVMRLLPGPTLEFTQTSVPEELSDAIDRTNHQLLNNPMTSQNNASMEALALTSSKKVMLVLVIGGLSFMEIAAFRFLSNHQDFPYRIVMASTKYSNGSKLLDSLSQL